MTTFGTLVIDVLGGDIRVSLAGSNYTVTYHKPRHSRQLLAKSLPANEDRNASMTQRVSGSRLESGQRQGERNGLDPLRQALKDRGCSRGALAVASLTHAFFWGGGGPVGFRAYGPFV
jgi:hypothetical protein